MSGKGRAVPPGTETKTEQGYISVKLPNGKWELKHRLIAAQKEGRPLKTGERVIFLDGNRENLNPDNITVINTNKSNTHKKLEKLLAKLQAVLEEIEDVKAQIAADEKAARAALKSS